MVRYDKKMREKCRQVALLQHKNMTDKEKENRGINISKGYKKAKLSGKKMGHFIPHTKESIEKISELKKGSIPWNKDKVGLYKTKESTKQLLREIRGKQITESGIGFPSVGKQENSVLNAIEKCIEPFKIKRQHYIKGFWLDGYCQALNMAIEVDESYHFTKEGNLSEHDIRRQKIIEEELKCNFFRINIGGN